MSEGVIQPDGKRCYSGPNCKLHGTAATQKQSPAYLQSAPNPDTVFTMKPKTVPFINNPLDRARQLIRQLSLKDMDSSLLANTILTDVSKMKGVDYEKVASALEVASYLHRDDTRANRKGLPRTPYIEHPLRNTLRIIRYGCTDQDLIIAELLHDTVEDHPFDLSSKFAGIQTTDEHEARENALNFISETYGVGVAHIVYKMSNPIQPKGMSKEDKRVAYVEHVKDVIPDSKVCVAKFSDFVDNAVGLYHNLVVDESDPKKNNMGMISHLSRKYLGLVDIWEDRLNQARRDNDLPVTAEGLDAMFRHLERGRQELTKLSKLS